MIYFITGGERSGKTTFAQKLALEKSAKPIYIATARIWDEDFKKRITRHKKDRGSKWINLEEEKFLSKLNLDKNVAVIDCITLWLTNFYADTGYDLENTLNVAKKEFDALIKKNSTFIIISNEIGMGVHAQTEKGRKFVEIQGWMNQYIAGKADKVIFMVSGIPVPIKE